MWWRHEITAFTNPHNTTIQYKNHTASWCVCTALVPFSIHYLLQSSTFLLLFFFFLLLLHLLSLFTSYLFLQIHLIFQMVDDTYSPQLPPPRVLASSHSLPFSGKITSQKRSADESVARVDTRRYHRAVALSYRQALIVQNEPDLLLRHTSRP